MKLDAIIIGAGISGLSVAEALHAHGLRCLILEKANRCGGVINSQTAQGYTLDTGPNLISDEKSIVQNLAERLSINNKIVFGHFSVRERYIANEQTLLALPSKQSDFLRTPMLPLPAKLRLFLEPFINRNLQDESIWHFFARRYGKQFAQHIFAPVVQGIYGCDADRLSIQQTFPEFKWAEKHFRSLSLASFLKKLQAKREQKKSGIKQNPAPLSFEGGLETLVSALYKHLQPFIILNTTSLNITKKESDYQIKLPDTEVYEAKHLIIATPAHSASQLLNAHLPELANLLSRVEYTRITCVHTGYSREQIIHPLTGAGCYYPAHPKQTLINTIWSSELFPGKAPNGSVLLTHYFRNTDMQQQLPTAPDLKTIERLHNIEGQPQFLQIFEQPLGIPRHTLEHASRLKKIKAILDQNPQLHLAGNYLNAISIPDCIEQSIALAETIKSNIQAIG